MVFLIYVFHVTFKLCKLLQNVAIQTELERERISLELEEEKKAQAEREKRLQEQARKIENLSSMVLCSNRDDTRNPYKKVFTKIITL